MKNSNLSLTLISIFSVSTVSPFSNPTPRLSSSITTSLASTAESTLSNTSDEIKTIAELKCEAGGTILNESSMLASQNFPISPEILIQNSKTALMKDSGVLDNSLWADNFEFCAPYVGPLDKEAFMDAAKNFGIYEAFPDFDNRYFGFRADPIEAGRVWFMTRLHATNSGTGILGKKEPSNKNVTLPPQMYSFLFNKDGKIRELTVGYPVDRRQGTTGGLGGMFGVFYGIGQALPFPEGKPYQLSKRFRFFTKVGNLLGGLTKKN